MQQLQSVYACADGTELTVEWEHSEDAGYRWDRDRVHWPRPLAPLDVALRRLGRDAVLRAFAEAGMPAPAPMRAPLFPHGLAYSRAVPLPPAELQDLVEGAVRLGERFGGSLAVWEQRCLPLIHASCRVLDEADANAPLSDLADVASYGLHQTQVALIQPHAAALQLTSFCKEAFGAEIEPAANELTRGSANATLDADQSLWEVAQVARREPAVRDAFLDTQSPPSLAAIAAVPGGAAFCEAFACYLDRFGGRAQGWDLLSPTWQERPEAALRLVSQALRFDVPSPENALQKGACRRDAQVQEFEQRFGSDHAARSRFRALLAETASYVAIREDRAFWQLTIGGRLRRALLRRAEPLLDAGLIGEAEDIFFLLPDEIEAGVEPELGAFRARAAERRADRERWSCVDAPVSIGGASATQPTAAPDAQLEPGLLRGVPASRGRVTAPARVITDLDDADRLQPGEVLVCTMTSPPWTPLFALAGAVVTETGNPLTHPAIAAREYGIPCVVAARAATRLIPDGVLVTVDGEEGWIRIEP
jgi:phosphohistidine swiveling domain-containing protein